MATNAPVSQRYWCGGRVYLLALPSGLKPGTLLTCPVVGAISEIWPKLGAAASEWLPITFQIGPEMCPVAEEILSGS